MTIIEMHDMFRTIGQQMGMQTIRGILPEDIDVYLNNQIINKVRSIVLENTAIVYNDKVSIQRNSIGVINSIRNLYTMKKVETFIGSGSRLEPYHINLNFDNEVMYYTGIINYYNNNKSFNCRILDGDILESTMNDYCNRSSWDAPIADFIFNNDMTVDIYTDESNKKPIIIGIRYIKKPAKVKLSLNGEDDVNSDLQSYLLPEIVTNAVNEYFKSVGSTSQNISN